MELPVRRRRNGLQLLRTRRRHNNGKARLGVRIRPARVAARCNSNQPIVLQPHHRRTKALRPLQHRAAKRQLKRIRRDKHPSRPPKPALCQSCVRRRRLNSDTNRRQAGNLLQNRQQHTTHSHLMLRRTRSPSQNHGRATTALKSGVNFSPLSLLPVPLGLKSAAMQMHQRLTRAMPMSRRTTAC